MPINSSHARRFAITLLLAALPIQAQTVKPTKPDEVVKLRTELVPLDMQIIDKKTHRMISDLTQNDVEVYEDGVRQPVTHFSQDKLPLSVVLLLDASGSMWTALEQLRAHALEALNTLKPEDEVAVVVTADDTLLLQDFTRDRVKVADTLRGLDFKSFGDNGIFLHDSLYRAGIQLQRAANPGNRRVVIAVTDNLTIQNNNWRALNKEQAELLLLETGVVVCGLVIKSSLYGRTAGKLFNFPERRAGGDVHKYAEITGGEVLASGDETVGQKLIELINHLRTRYNLAYTPTNSARNGKFRRLKVRLATATEQRLRRSGSEDPAIITRSGYYAAKR